MKQKRETLYPLLVKFINKNNLKPKMIDEDGYIRTRKSRLLHRQIAYHEIYLENKDLFPLPFSQYVIHHIDGNKRNNNIHNLDILTPEEHNKVHGYYETEETNIEKEKEKWIKIIKFSIIFTAILMSWLFFVLSLERATLSP